MCCPSCDRMMSSTSRQEIQDENGAMRRQRKSGPEQPIAGRTRSESGTPSQHRTNEERRHVHSAAAEEEPSPMRSPVDAIRLHWPEYLMEAAGLGLFMVSALCVTAALEHPHSPLHAVIPDPTLRRVLIGLCMGLTAVVII